MQILKAPHTYVRRMKRAAKMFQEQQRRKAPDAELNEFAECTFHPRFDASTAVKKSVLSKVQAKVEVRR